MDPGVLRRAAVMDGQRECFVSNTPREQTQTDPPSPTSSPVSPITLEIATKLLCTKMNHQYLNTDVSRSSALPNHAFSHRPSGHDQAYDCRGEPSEMLLMEDVEAINRVLDRYMQILRDGMAELPGTANVRPS